MYRRQHINKLRRGSSAPSSPAAPKTPKGKATAGASLSTKASASKRKATNGDDDLENTPSKKLKGEPSGEPSPLKIEYDLR